MANKEYDAVAVDDGLVLMECADSIYSSCRSILNMADTHS